PPVREHGSPVPMVVPMRAALPRKCRRLRERDKVKWNIRAESAHPQGRQRRSGSLGAWMLPTKREKIRSGVHHFHRATKREYQRRAARKAASCSSTGGSDRSPTKTATS